MELPSKRAVVRPALAVLGLTSFAIAQPALDIFGTHAEFFVAHGASAAETVVFALTVYVLPPVVIGLAVGLIGLWRRAAGRWALATAGAVLTGVAVLHALPGGVRVRPLLYVAIFVVVAVGAGWGFLRTSVMVRFWRLMGLLSPVVLVSFVFFSSASDIVFADDADLVVGGAAVDADVVFVLLDEFALASIVDQDGRLDEAKVPNLARLANRSTFYANTTTMAPATAQSIPSMLSGQIAEPGQLPLASEFPQNLFTLLAPSHELVVDEIVTRLCPDGLCVQQRSGASMAQLYDDARIVYLHTLLPSRWAQSWLPDITSRWTGFGDVEVAFETGEAASDGLVDAERAANQAARAHTFIERLGERTTAPRVEYFHLALPHSPYLYLPDGRQYLGVPIDGLANATWSDDETETAFATVRYHLQFAAVDALVGDMIGALEASDRFDRSMIVIVSDHGVTHRPGSPRRIPTLETLGDIAWVPLMVKYPDQTDGQHVEDPVQTIDILPTIAEVLEADLVAPVDGRSLLRDRSPPTRRILGRDEWDLDAGRHLADAVARVHQIAPPGVPPASLYAIDALQGSTGSTVADISGSDGAVREPIDGLVIPDKPHQLNAVDSAAAVVPALFRADVEGLMAGDHVAVYLNDRLAGSGRVNATGDRLLVMLDPRMIADGDNAVTVYLVADDLRLRPVPLAGTRP